MRGGVVRVHVTAPPVEGAANRAAIALLAEWLDVPRRSVAVVQGQAARDKLMEITSDDPAALARRIAARVDIAQGAD